MDRSSIASEARFEAYVEALIEVVGHADRAEPMRDYCTGLLLPMERKSVEPMAAATAPSRTAAKHQSLLHFVGNAKWSDEAVMSQVRELVLPAMTRSGPIEAWIVDDTGFPKKGVHSVGVARQYCGQLGKQDNCQVAVTLSIANAAASLAIAHRLYLPQAWASDAARRKKAGVAEASGAVLEPPAFIAGLEDVAVMRQPVEQCGGHLGVAEHRGPLPEREVGGDDDRGLLVEPADQVEQELTAGLSERQVAKFVEDDEVHTGEIIGHAALPSGAGLGLDIGVSEAETFWTAFLRKLMRRGLRGAKLVVSDAHQGLKAAIAKVLGANRYRCCVRHSSICHQAADLNVGFSARMQDQQSDAEQCNAADLLEAQRLIPEVMRRNGDKPVAHGN